MDIEKIYRDVYFYLFWVNRYTVLGDECLEVVVNRLIKEEVEPDPPLDENNFLTLEELLKTCARFDFCTCINETVPEKYVYVFETPIEIIHRVINGDFFKYETISGLYDLTSRFEFINNNNVFIDSNGRIRGVGCIKVDLDIDVDVLSHFFSTIQSMVFKPYAHGEVNKLFEKENLLYIFANSIISRIEKASFDSNKPEPRALGYWLWHAVNREKIFKNPSQAVSQVLRNPEDSGLSQDIINRLGYGASSERALHRFYKCTDDCIKAQEVLSIS